VRRLIFVAAAVEIGVLLIVVPWSSYWDRNYFAQQLPLLKAIITNNFVRGAVSGLGLVNLLAGLLELGAVFVPRRVGPPGIRAPLED
jgi:hypothetical protein